MKVYAYYRVSTKKQELGLDAQKADVRDYISVNEHELQGEFIEIESGRRPDRPILQKVLKKCRKAKALLLIAKMDRLARNLFFVAGLIHAKVDFKAVDYPDADRFELYDLARDAEKESVTISKRTKKALAIAKAKGVMLGEYGRNVLSKKNKAAAIEFARKMQPIIQKLMEEGYKSLRALAKALNRRRIATFTGHGARWHSRSVFNLLNRIESLEQIAH